MIDLATLALFVPAALALNITPGNDFLFCLGQGMHGGAGNGVAASLGIASGSLLHCLLGAFGLAALLALYPLAFEVLKWSGVVYLVWLGIKVFRKSPLPDSGKRIQADKFSRDTDDGGTASRVSADTAIDASSDMTASISVNDVSSDTTGDHDIYRMGLLKRQWIRTWADGVVINLLNPKVAIFILAFIPQFVDVQKGSAVSQFLWLGLVFNITGTAINAAVGISGAKLGQWLESAPLLTRQLQYLSALVFFALALRLALAD